MAYGDASTLKAIGDSYASKGQMAKAEHYWALATAEGYDPHMAEAEAAWKAAQFSSGPDADWYVERYL